MKVGVRTRPFLPDLFAESAKNSEHAPKAICSRQPLRRELHFTSPARNKVGLSFMEMTDVER